MAPNGATATSGIADLFRLDRIAADLFSGRCHAGAGLRVFGGQVAAQALFAAGRTVDGDRAVHSLNGTFLRPGDSRRPVEYRVERVRDGRTYSTRLATARQGGVPIFMLTASFKPLGSGHDRQGGMPDVPRPDQLPDPYPRWAVINPDLHAAAEWRRVVELRFATGSTPSAHGVNDELVWMQTTPLPDDGLAHAAAVTYCSDLTLGPSAALDIEPHVVTREGPRRVQMASLNHTMWFHRPFRADEWLLFAQRSSSSSDGRALTTGEFWSADGRLVASAAQEIALRPPLVELLT